MNKHLYRIISAAALLLAASAGWAATGGGATIHNAATLTFSGGQVTDWVNVEVRTIGSAPNIAVDNANVDTNAGDTGTLTYTVTSTSNGSDDYSLAVNSTDTDVGAPGLTITPPVITLGASITSQASDASGNVYIPAGSEDDLVVGDQVRINIGGIDYVYEIATLTPGTPASTTGNTTTPETPTVLTFTIVTPAAPVIGAGDVPAGTQIGELLEVVVEVTAGTPDTPGTDGSHEIELSGTTSAPGPGGTPVTFTDGNASTITSLSGDGTLTKEVRNVTTSGSFATSGVTAGTGDVLEYRLTAAPVAGQNLSGAVITDSIPQYTTYVDGSTTLNGAAVPDAGGTNFPLDEGGLTVNSPGGAAGDVLDGESAVVIFQVTVD